MSVAHKIGESPRTDDVVITESVDFAGLLLSKNVLSGLQNSGFERPSPIQLKAIPLGRCGLDLIVQAKSGTGKTCVFAVIALESLQVQAQSTQVLVLAPTREIAIQIWEVIRSLGSAIPGMQCHTFIGGMPLHEDKKKLQLCHIAVGTPGRIQNLIETGNLKTESIRLFVLDEADKLLEDSFQEQINWIYSALPDNKQILALSATYPESLAQHLTMYMRNPTFIRLNVTDPTLLGIKQYFTSVPNHPLPNKVFEAKTASVIHLLSSVSFHQCLIFSNMQTRAQNLESELTSCGWPTTCIAGSLEQKDRIMAMAKLKSYQCRILISTDLSSRGIDADKVNLVINMDIPKDHETYLHRIGRAGRFGSYGAAVTIISEGQELLDLQALEQKISTHIPPLPEPIPCDLVKHQLQVKLDDVVSTEQFITQPQSKGYGKLGLCMAMESQSNMQNQSGRHSYNELTNKLLPEAPLGTMEEKEKVETVKYKSGENSDASSVESDTSKLSYIQNGFPEKIVSVVPSKDGHFEVGVNGLITSTESTDFKNHSSDETHVDVDDKIVLLEPNIENTDLDLSIVKELVGAEENYPKVSSESKDAANQTNTAVKEDRDTVVMSDPSGESLAASCSLQINNLDDVVDSEVTSANCLSLCDAQGGQIKTMTDELNINMVTLNITKQSILPADSSASDKNQVSSCIDLAQNDIHLNSLSFAVETVAKDSSSCSKLSLDKAQDGQKLDESCLSKSKGKETLEDVCLNETKRRQALEEKFFSKTEMRKTSAEIQFDKGKLDQRENTSAEVSMWHSSEDVDSAGVGTDGHKARCNNAPQGHQEHPSASPAEVTGHPQTQDLNRETLEGCTLGNGTNASLSKVKNKTSRINAAATLWGDMLGKDFQEQEKRGSSNTLKALNGQSKKSTLDKENQPLMTHSNNMGKQKTKISSGACAVAKLWGDMLGSDYGDVNDSVADETVSKSSKQHRERKPQANSADDRVPRDSENMEQNLVQDTQDQKGESRRVKDGERKQIKMEQLSWESELALYVAARAKMNASQSSDKGETKETADVFTRPQKQARRRLAGVKKSSASENNEKAKSADSTIYCEAAQNREELEEKIQMTETISAKISPTRIAKNCLDKDSVRLDHLPDTTENESAAETIAKNILNSQAKEKTQTAPEEKQQTTNNTMTGLEGQQSSVVFEESDAATLGRLQGVGFNDDDFSADNSTSPHKLMSMKSVSQKNNLQDFENISSHHLETPGIRSILARLSASHSTNLTHNVHTYSAALQDYSLFLEQASSIDPPSVLNIVNDTFQSSSAVPSADDLKKISEFLHNFHGDIQHRVLSENVVAAGSDLQNSSVKEKGFDKATQTDCSFSHVHGVELGHSGMLTPKCESCSAVVKPILVSPVEPIPSECCDDKGKVKNDVQISQGEIQTKITFQRERELPVLPSFSPLKGKNKPKHVDRKNKIATFPTEASTRHEELPQPIAMNKMNAVNGQGSKLLLMKHRGDQKESAPNKQEQPVQEGACGTSKIGKNFLRNMHTSLQLPAKQTTGFLETEAEESFVSSLDSSSPISSDNEETEATAAEKPKERNTGFYKNRYTDEPAVPRVPPSQMRGSENDELARKRHGAGRKSKNLVTGCQHNDTKRSHQTCGFFTNEVNQYLDTLNFWHAWYYQKPGGYSNIPAQVGDWRSPYASGASLNFPHLHLPHNDSRADWFHSRSVPCSPAAYSPEGKNCRHSHKPQDPATLYVQSMWSRAKTQQEYIRQMVGFYKEMSKSQPSFFKNSN